MEADSVRPTVLAAIARIAPETDIASLRPDTPLRDQLDLDSMDWINLVAALHEQFQIDISESDYPHLATLDRVVAYLTSRRAAPAAEPRSRDTGAHDGGLRQMRHVINDRSVLVRPIRAEDATLEADFVSHLSPESRYGRFMVTVGDLPKEKLRYLTDVDQVRHVALIATVERDGREELVGVARYVVDPSGSSCEFAAAVQDAWQGSGVAGILMNELIGIARRRGLRTMEGIVLANNARMLKFTRQLGFSVNHDAEDRSIVRVLREL